MSKMECPLPVATGERAGNRDARQGHQIAPPAGAGQDLSPGILSDLAARIRHHHAEAQRAVLEHAMAAGDLLLTAKSKMPHGSWLSWLETSVGISARTAQVYMQVARARPKIESKCAGAAHLTLSKAVAVLSKPNPSQTIGADSKSYSKTTKPEQPAETTAADDDIANDLAMAESTDERDRLYGPLTGWEWIEMGFDCWCRAIRTGPAKRPGCYSDNYLKLIEHHQVPVLRWNEEERRQHAEGGA